MTKPEKLSTPFDAEIEQLERKLRRLQSKRKSYRMAARMQALWSDPRWRAKHLGQRRTEEYKATVSASRKQYCADPAVRAAMSERAKAQWADRKQRERKVAGILAAHTAKRLNKALVVRE